MIQAILRGIGALGVYYYIVLSLTIKIAIVGRLEGIREGYKQIIIVHYIIYLSIKY